MSILALIIYLAVIGALVWLINSYIPMEPIIKKLITVVAICGCLLLILYAFGLLGQIGGVQVPHIR